LNYTRAGELLLVLRWNFSHFRNLVEGWMTPGILPFAFRASLRLFKIVPDDFVEPRRRSHHLQQLVPHS
jgi:hypothetical protein